MKSKKYYIDLINHTKIIKESETLNSNGNIHLFLELSPLEYSSNKMTINDLAKTVDGLAKQLGQLANTVNDLAIEMREGFKQVNQRLDQVEIRLDKIEKRLDEHDAIFARNNLI